MINQDCKYKTWKEVFDAFESGELDKEQWAVFVDNDYACLHYTGPLPEGDDESDAEAERRYEQGRAMFYHDAPVDPCEIFQAIGIPAVYA